MNPKWTMEVGVFKAILSFPRHRHCSMMVDDRLVPLRITTIDIDREAYEVGLPHIQKVGTENKINFIQAKLSRLQVKCSTTMEFFQFRKPLNLIGS
ncbi:unnamed protein product [Dovyalis caffra]|uniref:Uncharacterized protein n=1 Tax=Dovyalis caffra TaxID=77055 RepID=A0AAV1R2U1_9ROSI|nr:unnamed protein product [Dovyalis caffra]